MTAQAPSLLVAHPRLMDPNFLHTVVLLVDHDEEGSMGFILNRPLPLRLSKICRDAGLPFQGDEEAFAFRGGPVEPSRGLLLVRHGGLPEPEDSVLDFHHYVSFRRDLLQTLSGDPQALFRLFLGYAGWAPGQLEGEMEQGAWIQRPLVSEWLLTQEPLALWSLALGVASA